MSEASDHEIVSAVEKFIAGRSADEVIAAIYDDSAPQCLADITAILPNEQIATIALIERLNRSDTCSLVILHATLRGLCSRDEWIHYNICKVLERMSGMGARQARMPSVIHALLAIEGLDDFTTAHTIPLGVVARELALIAPREAIRRGMLAAKRGDDRGINLASKAIDLLSLRDHATGSPISQAFNLAKSLHLDADNIQQSTSLTRASGIQTTPIERPRQIVAPPAHGDTSHYMLAPSGQPVELPGIVVHSIRNGTFSIDASSLGLEQHYVFDENMNCIVDFAHGTSPFTESDVIEFDQPVAILDDQFSGSSLNICHFLLDRMTRVPLYEQTWRRPGKFLLVDNYSYQNDIIARMNLTDRVYVPKSKRITIRAPEILFSSNIARDFTHPAHYGSPWALNYLRQALRIQDRPAMPGRKILISRGDVGSRRILNWSEVQPIFERHGFEITQLAGLPTDAQISLFQDAAQVVGVHGAGLTNILFAPRDCSVLEILPPYVATRAYWLLASGLGQRYTTMIADDPELPRPDYKTWTHDPSHNPRDIILPVTELDAVLASL